MYKKQKDNLFKLNINDKEDVKEIIDLHKTIYKIKPYHIILLLKDTSYKIGSRHYETSHNIKDEYIIKIIKGINIYKPYVTYYNVLIKVECSSYNKYLNHLSKNIDIIKLDNTTFKVDTKLSYDNLIKVFNDAYLRII